MLKNKIIKNLIFAVTIFSITFAMFVVAVFFLQDKISSFDEKIEILKKQQIKRLNGNKLRLLADLTADDRNTLSDYFLQKEEDAIVVLNKIESLAKKLGVKLKINHLSLSENKKTSENWIEISLISKGDYKQILVFTEALENLPFLSRLTQINLVKEKDSDIWKADFTLSIMLL